MSNNEVAVQQDNLPIDYTDMESMSGLGAESATQEDYAIPFIQIAQALSPQLDESDSKYIDGLKKGQLFNTVTGETFPEGVTVIPVKFERKAIEFNLREKGGGLVAIHDAQDGLAKIVERDDRNRDITADGTQIVDTRSFYCIVLGEEGPYPALISMKSTQAKKAKQWMSMISGIKLPRKDGNGTFTPPMFSHTYTLTTAQESNNDGTWHGFVIAKGALLDTTDPLFNEAVEFYKSLSAGDVKVDYAAQDGVPAADDDEGDVAF